MHPLIRSELARLRAVQLAHEGARERAVRPLRRPAGRRDPADAVRRIAGPRPVD